MPRQRASIASAFREMKLPMEEKKELQNQDERVVEIELERLRGFVNHPFKVQADSQMIELQESIKKYGILNPLIEVSLVNAMSRELILRSMVDRLREFYDYIIIDCMCVHTLADIVIIKAYCTFLIDGILRALFLTDAFCFLTLCKYSNRCHTRNGCHSD